MKLACLVLVAACSKDAPAIYTPTKIVALALPSLGLTIDAPDAVKIGTTETNSIQIDWPGVKLTVRRKGDPLFETDLGSAGKTASGFAKVTKQESTADGWELRYQETYAGETLHNVTVARTINGIEVQCKGAGNSPTAEAQLATACASLRN